MLEVHLREVDIEVGSAAVNEHIGSSLFLPAVAELVAAELRVKETASGMNAINEDSVRWLVRHQGVTWAAACDFERARIVLVEEEQARTSAGDPTFDYDEWWGRYCSASAEMHRHQELEFA